MKYITNAQITVSGDETCGAHANLWWSSRVDLKTKMIKIKKIDKPTQQKNEKNKKMKKKFEPSSVGYHFTTQTHIKKWFEGENEGEWNKNLSNINQKNIKDDD